MDLILTLKIPKTLIHLHIKNESFLRVHRTLTLDLVWGGGGVVEGCIEILQRIFRPFIFSVDIIAYYACIIAQ